MDEHKSYICAAILADGLPVATDSITFLGCQFRILLPDKMHSKYGLRLWHCTLEVCLFNELPLFMAGQVAV